MFSTTQLLRRVAQTNPDGVATVMDGREQSWSQLQGKVAKLAAGLAALGVRPGDHVAILAPNSDRYFELLYAIPWAGAVVVPINCRLADAEIEFWLSDAEASLLLVDDAFVERVQKMAPGIDSLQQCVYMGYADTPAGFVDYNRLSDHPPVEDRERCNDDLAALYYTGGTTGRSKGVMLSHTNLTTNALQSSYVLKVEDNERILHVAPMFHIAAAILCNSSAIAGGSNYFLPAFDPEAVMQAIESHRIERMLLVPTMVNMLVHHPKIGDYDLGSLRNVLYGASPMPEAVIARAMQVLPTTKFYQGYGQTEAAPFLTALSPDRHVLDGPLAGKLTSAGQAIPGVDIKIVDENDNALPVGAVGEVCVRGANVMLGYHKLPEVTAATLKNGWLHTGDGGRMDEEGFLYVVDRVKDMIVSGAENVYSIEVENALYQHPAVGQCAVIGIPGGKWGEQVHAIVVPAEGASVSEADLIAHCRELIADFKCPRSVSFQQEPLPLSGAGKILKAELRKPYWKDHDRAVN